MLNKWRFRLDILRALTAKSLTSSILLAQDLQSTVQATAEYLATKQWGPTETEKAQPIHFAHKIVTQPVECNVGLITVEEIKTAIKKFSI